MPEKLIIQIESSSCNNLFAPQCSCNMCFSLNLVIPIKRKEVTRVVQIKEYMIPASRSKSLMNDAFFIMNSMIHLLISTMLAAAIAWENTKNNRCLLFSKPFPDIVSSPSIRMNIFVYRELSGHAIFLRIT